MDSRDRKAATAAYKKREAVAGLFVVRQAPSGATWVGYARDVEAIQNRVWFSLRTGGHTNRALQAAWNSAGESAFSFEVVDLVDADALGLNPEKVLRERVAAWCKEFGANPL